MRYTADTPMSNETAALAGVTDTDTLRKFLFLQLHNRATPQRLKRRRHSHKHRVTHTTGYAVTHSPGAIA